MTYFVYATHDEAAAAQAAVDARLGYPDATTETQTYASIIEKPDGSAWAYLADDVTIPIVGGSPTPQPLDATWNPPGSTLP